MVFRGNDGYGKAERRLDVSVIGICEKNKTNGTEKYSEIRGISFL